MLMVLAKKRLFGLDEEGNREECTYDDLMKNVNKIGNAFMKNGLRRGDKVLVRIPQPDQSV